MNTKKLFSSIFSITLLLILFTGLPGCKKSEGKKIGFLYSSNITIRFNKESKFFKERAEELGAQVVIDHAADNDAVQYEKAIQMMEEGIDLLTLIAVNINTAENIVKEAKARDIPVIAYNRLIANSDLDVYISGNNDELGKDMAGYALKQRPSGNYVILNGDRFDRNAVELMESIDKTLKPHIDAGKINILYKTYIENWNPDHAAHELNQFMKANPEPIDAIISGFDGLSVACIDVLEKYDLAGKVIVTGQDAQIESCRRIVEGTQHMTMYHPLKEIAYKAAEVAVDILNGEKLDKKHEISYSNNGFKDVPTIQISSIPVTKKNIDEVLIESGFYTREEIY
ncbi:substrate-binding domain-containing protein [Marinilabilia salmonicolor]|uniref:D-xylose transport system substrate-binding protein n=1 Tax=Marinilabilia salmonicolor TaxID=989 RepID=A0A368V496_9BACT|nr:substrate-binding domain-containing protein [Marinilabilia salmonicolor]RCW34514.1 D-xylose transport system substrate-binding protein [Marinilabilia salmonicolor]